MISACGATLAAGGLAASLVGLSASASALAPLRSIVLVGHGDGPGIGMGQWGAFGDAVRYHLSYQQILAHFYGGTRASSLAALGEAANPTVSVVLLENLDLSTNVGYDPVLTAASTFTLDTEVEPAGPPAASAQLASAKRATRSTTSTTEPSTTTAPSTTTSTTTALRTTSSAAARAKATRVLERATSASTSPTTTTPTTLATTTTSTLPVSSTSPTSTAPTTEPSTTTTAPSGTVATKRALVVRAGEAIDLRLQANGTWSAYEAASCTAAGTLAGARGAHPVATGLVDPIVEPPSSAANAPASKLLTVCRHDGVDETVRGSVEAYDRDGYERTINLLPLQSYLEGVVPAEVSASWGLDGTTAGAPQDRPWGYQALEVQAVAARSYLLANAAAGGWEGYADICDTAECQAYVGVNYATTTSNAAVAATIGQVRVSGPGKGAIVLARFSASSGGWTTTSAFPAVEDLGDACVDPNAPLECNPVHSWSLSLSAAELDRAFPAAGRVSAVVVTGRNHDGQLGGRVLTVEVTGSKATLRLDGTSFGEDLGLLSNWFAVSKVVRKGSTTTTTTTTSLPAGSTTSPSAPPTTATLPPPVSTSVTLPTTSSVPLPTTP